MATTSIWRVNGSLGKVIVYVENSEKTDTAGIDNPFRISLFAQNLFAIIFFYNKFPKDPPTFE